MTFKMTLKWMAFLVVVLMTAQVCAEEPQVLKTQKDKVNYGIGVSVVRNFKQQGFEIDLDAVVKGMKDAHSGVKLLMTDAEIHKTMASFQKELRLKQRQTKIIAAADNKKEGDAFLAENKKKVGVVTLPSGLQYIVLKAGDGKKPTDADTVECHYRGTLIDGTEFDSSDRSKQPATFTVTGVIPGWREALKLMPMGSKWQLFIPPQLAYGERGSGSIGPNATLIFELELLAVK
ncbi:MAG: FKBP-type peptidyl-prolyl cis-trans isomerase [Deltaproteobacteria bacterium]|nr:FKBP-type peptidyl-prolyl cis-trans isomerase [Deltaproteobacteria bacterium]